MTSITYLIQGDFKKSLSILDKIISGLLFVDAKLLAAEIIVQNKSTEEAIESLSLYKNISSSDKLRFLRAKTSMLFNDGRPQDAFELLKSEDKNYSDSSEFKFDYAMLAEKMGNLLLMEQLLKEAIKIKPDFALAYNALGYSYADRNIKLADAKKYIEIALSIEPKNHYIIDSMGWLHYRLGNIDIALEFTQKAYAIQKDPEIAAHLGEIYWKKGEKDEAKRIWQDSLVNNPSNSVLNETFQRFN